jgi:filamentous hemagglutinin
MSVEETKEKESIKETTKSNLISSETTTEIKTTNTTTNKGSSITTGGTTTISAENIKLQNADIESQGDVSISATKNINLTTALDTTYSYSEKSKDNNWTGGSLDIVMHATGENKATNINSGGNITITAGKDINSVSAQYNAEDDLTLSGTNVNLLAAQDYDKTYEVHEEWGGIWDMINPANIKIDISESGLTASSSYEKSKDENESETTIAAVNQINAGGKLNIDAGNNIISQGSQISAGGDVEVSAGNNIMLITAKRRRQATKKRQ